MYPCSITITIQPNKSDHNPIMVEVSADPVVPKRKPKRYRFEEMWAQHADCLKVIQQGWAVPSIGDPMQQVGLKISSTGKFLME